MDKRIIKKYYEDLLQYDFLPYWSKFVDDEHGGILNCINNYGNVLLAEDKFTWSQGRWLWVLGRIYDLKMKGHMKSVSKEDLERWMEETWSFIVNHSIYDDCICCYVLTRDGEKKRDTRTGRYDASIYADCFALIGMSQYVKVMHAQEKYSIVENLYLSIKKRIDTNDYLTEPYPVPEGFEVHGIPMILINTVQEYILMKQELHMDVSNEIAYAEEKLEFILNELYDGSGHIMEYKKTGNSNRDTLLERHINPGHTLEDAWFWLEYLEKFGDLQKYLPKICNIVKQTFELGWDTEYGGLLRFVDCEGGKPKGNLYGGAYEQLILETWDMKLWWPHSEILFLFLKLYDMTGDDIFMKYYEQSFAYVFTVFPNRELGEWIQIRKRDGSPEEKLVALPVKDPFHIMRNYIKIVELCI